MEIKREDGKLKTFDELWDEAKEYIEDELNSMREEDAMPLGNEIRGRNHYDTLYVNNEETVNDVLDGETPWNILNDSGWESGYDYFTYDYGFNMTDDVWYDLDTEDIAEGILEGEWYNYLPFDLKCYVDEYEEAKEELENYNPDRAMVEEVIRKYVNCEADVTDLLQTLDKLARNDELWEE